MFLSTRVHIISHHAAQLSHCAQGSSSCTLPSMNPHSGHSPSLSSPLSVDRMFSSEKDCYSSGTSTLAHVFLLIWFVSLVAFDSSLVYILVFVLLFLHLFLLLLLLIPFSLLPPFLLL